VVALPVYLQSEAEWSALQVSTLLALWVIGYGLVQSLAPRLLELFGMAPPNGPVVVWSAAALALASACVLALVLVGAPVALSIVTGLLVFGAVFAINSAVHSYLIVHYAEADGVSLDVGFYYMANALGRLLGTLLSGAVYQLAGFEACIAITLGFVVLAGLISRRLPG